MNLENTDIMLSYLEKVRDSTRHTPLGTEPGMAQDSLFQSSWISDAIKCSACIFFPQMLLVHVQQQGNFKSSCT